MKSMYELYKIGQNVPVARDRPEAGPRDLQEAWQAQQKRTSEPPGPHPSSMLHTPFMERGDVSRLYTAIINLANP